MSAVGVPEITPVEELMLIPVGSVGEIEKLVATPTVNRGEFAGVVELR